MKQALLKRLDNALRELYHNATPNHPRNVPESLWETYNTAFNMWAECEIDYIQSGFAHTAKEYKRFARLGVYPCEAVLREARIVQLLENMGKLYTWGRGGRTLAPNGLINQRGGSSFSVKSASHFEDWCNAALVELVQQVEAFNEYVERWNSCENLQALWDDYCANELYTLKDCAKDTRLTLRKLAREAIALAGVAGDAPCNVLQREIARQKAHHKELVQQIINFSQARKEA